MQLLAQGMFVYVVDYQLLPLYEMVHPLILLDLVNRSFFVAFCV